MHLRTLAVTAATIMLLPLAGAQAQTSDPVYPALGTTTLDVLHYDLDLRWFEAAGLQDTTATIRARARVPMTSFALDLHGLTVSTVEVDGTPAVWSRVGSKLIVERALAAGAVFTTTVHYAGQPETLVSADGSREGWLNKNVGAIVLGEPRGSMTWYPNNNTPSDKASYDVHVEVPDGFQAVSNGRNTAVVPNGLRTTWHWTTPEPMATYLATVAIGKFNRYTETVDGIRYDSFVATSAPSNSKAIALLPKVVRQAAKWFGPYPFSDAGIIVDDASVLYALELQNRPFFPQVADTTTLVHEMAHQWFGDSVTPKSWNHIWLNEGFATYAEWLWKAKRGGRTPAAQLRASYRNTGTWKPAPLKVTPATLFDDAVYTRGAMTLQVLRERIGTKKFFRTLRTWAATHRHGTGTTRQFKLLAEKISGRQLDGLFHDWLAVPKKPRGYLR